MAFYILAFYSAIICAILQISFTSYCGESAIPFSFEVLPDGHPILGCARPNCFGWDAFGKAIRANESHFYRIKKQPDGFFRKTLTTNAPKPISDKEAPWYQPQTATCQSGFKPGRCSGLNNWVGGIGPITGDSNSDQNPLLLRCCKWAGLAQTSDRGIATVRNGQIVYGGEVVQSERQYAFDYVSDIHRIAVPSSNEAEKRSTLHYEVSIRRMACLPRPEQLTWDIEPGVMKELFQRFALAEKEEAEANANASPRLPQLDDKKSSKGHKLKTQRAEVDSEAINGKRHQGESRVIKTSTKWVSNPADDGDSQEAAAHVHLASSKGHNKAFLAAPNVAAESSAAIQGPFIENEIEAPAAIDYEVPDEHQKQQQLETNKENVPQGEPFDKHVQYQNGGLSQSSYVAPSGGAVQIRGSGKKRIICDRNVTTGPDGSRLKRQASCEEEEATEIDVPEGSQVEVQQQGYYDPGVQQQTYYYQSQGGTPLRLCFTGDTRVRRANGQMARMDELTVGEWVYSANKSHLVYSIVESWIHRVPDQLANFVRLRLQDGRELKLTEQHFIYKRSNCLANNNHRPEEPFPVEKIYQEELVEMVFAENVVPGDCVFAQRENSDLSLLFEQPVIAVDIVQERGIYAPMTGTGDILVEGILASCYAIEPSPALQKSIFNSLKSSPFVEMLFGHTNEYEMHLPSWLHFVVEHLMPVVLPK